MPTHNLNDNDFRDIWPWNHQASQAFAESRITFEHVDQICINDNVTKAWRTSDARMEAVRRMLQKLKKYKESVDINEKERRTGWPWYAPPEKEKMEETFDFV